MSDKPVSYHPMAYLWPACLMLFLTLKLTGVIDWSWLWVLSPLWGWFLAALAFTSLTALAIVLEELGRSRK